MKSTSLNRFTASFGRIALVAWVVGLGASYALASGVFIPPRPKPAADAGSVPNPDPSPSETPKSSG